MIKQKTIKLLLFTFSIIIINNIHSINKKSRISLFNNKTILDFSQLSDSTSIDKLYSTAYLKFKNENYLQALKGAYKIYEKSKKENNHQYAYLSSELIADIYDKTYENKKALIFYQQGLKYLNKSANNNRDSSQEVMPSHYFAKIYLRLGSAYLREYINLKSSLEKKTNLKYGHNKSSSKYKDSAVFFFKKIDLISDFNDQIQKYKAMSYTNLSGLYQLDSSYLASKKFALKAVNIHKKRNDPIKLAYSLNNLGNISLLTGNFSDAKKTYIKAIETINKDKRFKTFKLKATLFSNLAWAMRKLGEIEAYDNLETSYELEDNLREKDWKRLIKKLENEHNQNLNQQKIELIKSQTELLKTQQDKSTLLVSILSILGLIISGVVIYNYRLRQNNLQLKISQNKLIEKQNIDRIKSESQIKILNATIDGKETERKQIAETLHDSVSALLSSANMHLRATKKQFNGNTPVELEKTQQIILEASQKVRDLSHNLVSSILLKFGLGYAIKDIGSKYSNSELHFHTNISNISRYNQEFEIKLYNVIHELINNILKHSKASNAHIVLEDKNGFLSVLIEDDGIGFNYKDNKIKTGLGLNQIEARIQMMNGNFLIESAKEKGTKATITVPIKNRSLVTA